jgi:alkylhydroperoxidase family enzyme
MDRQFDVLYGYLALARRPGATGAVDDRIRLVVRRRAAERSGCRWCIDHARHDWRVAGLPVDLLGRPDRQDLAAELSAAERAAIALVDAVACGGAREALAEVRRHFSERATAELVACMADHHLFADEHS